MIEVEETHEIQRYEPDASDMLRLRQRTSAPILACKHALMEAHGRIDEAARLLKSRLSVLSESEVEMYD